MLEFVWGPIHTGRACANANASKWNLLFCSEWDSSDLWGQENQYCLFLPNPRPSGTSRFNGRAGIIPAIPENRGIQKKMEIQFFFSQKIIACPSILAKLVTLQVTTKMSKLLDNACLWQRKTEFHFFSVFSGIAIIPAVNFWRFQNRPIGNTGASRSIRKSSTK